METIYQGSHNTLVRRAKFFSLSTLLVTVLGAPVFLLVPSAQSAADRKGPRQWSLRERLAMFAGVGGASLLTSLLFHKVAGRYVFAVRVPARIGLLGGKSRLHFTTVGFWGRLVEREYPLADIRNIARGITVWRAESTGQAFSLQTRSSLGHRLSPEFELACRLIEEQSLPASSLANG